MAAKRGSGASSKYVSRDLNHPLSSPCPSMFNSLAFLGTHPTWKWRLKAYDPEGEWMLVCQGRSMKALFFSQPHFTPPPYPSP